MYVCVQCTLYNVVHEIYVTRLEHNILYRVYTKSTRALLYALSF